MSLKNKSQLVSICIFVLACNNYLTGQSIDLLWKFESGSGIRGGFVKEANQLYFGNSDGIVHSIDTKTATIQWTFKAQGAINSTPALTKNSIIVGSRDNNIYSLNKDTGKQIWKFTMKPNPAHRLGWDYFMSSPLVNSKMTYVGSGDQNLYALDTETGRLLWTFKTGDKIRATPTLHNEKLYIPSFDGFVYVLDALRGNLLWRFETEGASLESENFGWDRRSINSTPVITDSLMVFGSRDGSVYCVNILTRKQKWKFSYGPTWAIVTPAIVNNTVMVGWSDNSLFCAIDLLTGKEKWNFNCGSFIYSNPVVSNRNVYFGSGNGRIICLDQIDGKLKWEHRTLTPVLSNPLFENGKLFIADDDGVVYCLSETSAPRGVYHPRKFQTPFIEHGLAIDTSIDPYFTSRGFVPLDSAALIAFMENCINQNERGVVILAHDYLPATVLEKNGDTSLLRKFMEAGGRVVGPGLLPGIAKLDSTGNFNGMNYKFPTELMGISIDAPLESGNYFAKATDAGLRLGLPKNLRATNAMVSPEGLEILAMNEIGRPAIWMKKIGTKGGGYIACRTWSYLTTAREENLEVLWKLCR